MEWNIATCSNVDEPKGYHTNYIEKTNISWYRLHVESKNTIQMNLCTKQKHTHRHIIEREFMVTNGERDGSGGGVDKLGVWD